MTKRDEQREQRRREILMFSLDVFIKRGFSATKIRDIAKELNVSVGLFFHYYESKEKIYEELVKIALDGTKAVMEVPEKSSPIEVFEEIAKLVFKELKSDPMSAKLFLLMKQTMNNEAIPQKIKDILFQVNSIQTSVPIILEGQKQGVIRKGNPVALSLAFWSSIQGIAETMVCNPELPYPEGEWVVDILRRKTK